MDFYGFYTGTEFHAHEYLGAHVTDDGVVFRVFAPAASGIAVIGEFNEWNGDPMNKIYDGNFWECVIPTAKVGQMYKYRIYDQSGGCLDRCDPYGRRMELRPHSASIICGGGKQKFTDEKWLKTRDGGLDKPLNIYEIHAGSWRCKPDEEDQKDVAEHWYNYRELADLLVPYLKENHYHYVEMMPLAEHPSDESWGYQISGFFSPTSRYGTPDDLKYLVNKCHNAGIGVIMDFVPVHFAVDDYALWNFDGTALYEYPHGDVGKSEWGSCNFMHSRGEVRSFLQSAADYWLEEFHFDGLRMDAISNLIYWQGNPARGENKDAVQFLQNLNSGLKARFPSALLIAEDSTARPNITTPVWSGGLGFDYKWDMGWMNDTLSYFQAPVSERMEKYYKLTFSMQYFYDEKYLLPFSHDENVHGKATILQKMNGDYEGKFPQGRALYLYMYAHPGKKLNFMGNELGQLYEWSEAGTLDWALAERPFHRFFHSLCKTYRDNPALHCDYAPDSFSWADSRVDAPSLIGMVRRGHGETLLALCNFGSDPAVYDGPLGDAPSLLLHTDLVEFGGDTEEGELNTELPLLLPPYSGMLLRIE